MLAAGWLSAQTAPPDPAEASLESLLRTKVVTASRFSENLADAPGVMTVVSREEIERFGGLTLREILSRVSGLDWTSSDYTDRSMIAVRGDQSKSTGVHVLFLINGRPTREVLEGGIVSDLMEAFPVGILDRIEVIEGPGSVLYGSNAFSGVINLITKKVEGSSGSFRGFGGAGGGPTGGSASGTYRRGDFRFAAAAQFHGTDRSTVPVSGYPPDQAPDPFPFFSNSRGLYAEAGYKGWSAMLTMTEWRGPFEVNGNIGDNRWRRTFADLGYDFKPARHWEMGIHTTFTGTALESSSFPGVERHSGEVETDWTNSLEINSHARVAFGALYNYQYGRERLSDGVQWYTATDTSRPGGGLYAQLEFEPVDGLKIIGGFQTNKTRDVPVGTVPRVGVIWSPFEHWHVKTLYGEAFRAPSLNETHINNPFIQGNLNLLPERSVTFDVGVTYQTSRLQTGVNYFRTRQSNDIVQQLGDDGVIRYQNAGGLLLHGVQWEWKSYLRPHWLIEASALYQSSRSTDGTWPFIPTEPTWGARAASATPTATAGLSASSASIRVWFPATHRREIRSPPPTNWCRLTSVSLSRIPGSGGKAGCPVRPRRQSGWSPDLATRPDGRSAQHFACFPGQDDLLRHRIFLPAGVILTTPSTSPIRALEGVIAAIYEVLASRGIAGLRHRIQRHRPGAKRDAKALAAPRRPSHQPRVLAPDEGRHGFALL
jgi:outer membrane cobalamin receptor